MPFGSLTAEGFGHRVPSRANPDALGRGRGLVPRGAPNMDRSPFPQWVPSPHPTFTQGKLARWAGAATFPGTACGRRVADHRFPEASALREKVEANGGIACHELSPLQSLGKLPFVHSGIRPYPPRGSGSIAPVGSSLPLSTPRRATTRPLPSGSQVLTPRFLRAVLPNAIVMKTFKWLLTSNFEPRTSNLTEQSHGIIGLC